MKVKKHTHHKKPIPKPSKLKALTRCHICKNELEFAHITHFEFNTVTEEAFCCVCHTSATERCHKLH